MMIFWFLELILSAAGSGPAFGMRIRIHETNLMRIHADPEHWNELNISRNGDYSQK